MKNSYLLLVIMILLSSCQGQLIVWDGFQLIKLVVIVTVVIVGVMIAVFNEIVKWIKGE